MEFLATSGTQYIIRMGVYDDINTPGAYGTWQVVVGCTPFNDDLCTDHTPVGALPATVVGDLFGATTGDPGQNCVITAANGAGRWYSTVGTGNTQIASLCGTPTAFPGVVNTRIHVYCNDANIFASDDCSELVCVTGNDTASPACGVHARATFPTTSGQLYRMLVSSSVASFTTTRNFQLIVTDNGTPATGQVNCAPPPPANDLCANAQNLDSILNNTTGADYTNLGALPADPNPDENQADPCDGLPNDVEVPDGSPSCQWRTGDGACPDAWKESCSTIWFTVTVPANGIVRARVCTSSSANGLYDSIMGMYTGTCGSLVEVACGEDNCNSAAPYYSFVQATGLTPGSTVYVMVGSTGGWEGDTQGIARLTVFDSTQ